jgi:hypothetical protein
MVSVIASERSERSNLSTIKVISYPFIFFAYPKKTKQKKGYFLQGVFAYAKPFKPAKFPPRLRKFLTRFLNYTAQKDF